MDDKYVNVCRGPEETGVINQSLLISLITEQGPKGEAGKLFLEDGIEFEKVKEIRIEFLNILHIDHLWVLRNLVKLKLCNNIIGKIENLESLVHLQELDLSFNRLEIIEGLDRLEKLEILLLYQNKISELTGIEHLTELMIFSIGNNHIADWDHVMYLRQFKKLKSLNMSGNPCMEKPGYLEYLYAFIPQLKYFQYKRITATEKSTAFDKHYRAISVLEESEAKEQMTLDAKLTFEKHIELVSMAYVEYLDEDYLFQKMFEHDKEGNDLMSLNEDTVAAHEEYKKVFTTICHDLFDLGLKQQTRREEEIRIFNDAVNKGKEAVQNEARNMMDDVVKRKTDIFQNIKKVTKSMMEELEPDVTNEKIELAQRLSENFNDFVSKTWNKLMSQEVILHDQIEDINETFRINMTDTVGSFIEAAQGFFTMLRNAEADYNENITSIITFYINSFTDESKIPENFLEICGDKDILANTLAASHDLHLRVIDNREDILIGRLKKWLKEYTENLVKEERERNRKQILEISHFLEYQKEEFEDLQIQHQAELANLDLNMAVAFEG